ncbi:MAG: hypothetical protein AAF466_06250 [Bacteroidota bacterium]
MLKNVLLFSLLFTLFSCKERQGWHTELTDENSPEYDSIYGELKEFLNEEGDSLSLALIDSLQGNKIRSKLKQFEALSDYLPSSKFGPNHLLSDFSGDGRIDHAVFTRSAKDGKHYLVLFHAEDEYYVIGGGDGMEDGNLTLDWVTGIEVFVDRETFRTIIDEETGDILDAVSIALNHNAIALRYGDSGIVGILYWDGTNYTYIHQFD